MEVVKKKLVTIIAEAILERGLTQDILKLGAHGYTVVEARGAGEKGVRSAESEQDRNIRLEAVCNDKVAGLIVDHVMAKYAPNYALVIYLSEVEVVRAGKF